LSDNSDGEKSLYKSLSSDKLVISQGSGPVSTVSKTSLEKSGGEAELTDIFKRASLPSAAESSGSTYGGGDFKSTMFLPTSNTASTLVKEDTFSSLVSSTVQRPNLSSQLNFPSFVKPSTSNPFLIKKSATSSLTDASKASSLTSAKESVKSGGSSLNSSIATSLDKETPAASFSFGAAQKFKSLPRLDFSSIVKEPTSNPFALKSTDIKMSSKTPSTSLGNRSAGSLDSAPCSKSTSLLLTSSTSGTLDKKDIPVFKFGAAQRFSSSPQLNLPKTKPSIGNPFASKCRASNSPGTSDSNFFGKIEASNENPFRSKMKSPPAESQESANPFLKNKFLSSESGSFLKDTKVSDKNPFSRNSDVLKKSSFADKSSNFLGGVKTSLSNPFAGADSSLKMSNVKSNFDVNANGKKLEAIRPAFSQREFSTLRMPKSFDEKISQEKKNNENPFSQQIDFSNKSLMANKPLSFSGEVKTSLNIPSSGVDMSLKTPSANLNLASEGKTEIGKVKPKNSSSSLQLETQRENESNGKIATTTTKPDLESKSSLAKALSTYSTEDKKDYTKDSWCSDEEDSSELTSLKKFKEKK